MDVKSVVILVIILWSAGYVNSANILVIIPTNCPSHFIMFNKLLIALAERGHNLDVISHYPQKKPFPGITDFSIEDDSPQFKNDLSVSLVGNQFILTLFEFVLRHYGYEMCAKAFETQVLKDLRYSKKKYDLLITQLFASDCIFGFAHVLKVPVVSLVASVALPWGSDRIGIPDNPSYIPTCFTSATNRMTLKQRIKNFYMLVISKLGYYFFSEKPTNKLAKEFFGSDLPDIDELILNTSLVLVNSHFSINTPRPTVPNFIEVGGLHIGTPKPVPKHLENLIQSNTNGFIYLTMGSMIMTESFSAAKLQGMFDAFAKLPFTVLWKANVTRFPAGLKIPSHIHFETWMPQFDLLCHPKLRLFVSHGGLLGSQEAIYCGVPRIGIPIFADQGVNIFHSVEMGIAVKVDYNNITKESILEAATEILYNDKLVTFALTCNNNNNNGKFAKILDNVLVDKELSLQWLEPGYLHPETEGFLVPIQDKVIFTRNYDKHIIEKANVHDVCRLCNSPDETIEHIITAGCQSLAHTVYLARHNDVAKIIHIEFALIYKLLDNSPPYYKYSPELVLDTANVVLYWDRTVLTSAVATS